MSKQSSTQGQFVKLQNCRNHHCHECGEVIDPRRAKLKKRLCLDCQQDYETHNPPTRCVVPMHKSNYILVTDKKDLLGINNKGGLIK